MKTNKCKNPTCNEPRMINEKTGQTLTYCPMHQREVWRNNSKAKQPGKNVLAAEGRSAFAGSIGDNGTAIEAANVQPARIPRLSDEEKADMIRRAQERINAKHAEPASVEKSDADIDRLAAAIGSQPTTAISPRLVDQINKANAHACANTCDDCLYKDVVQVLEKSIPGVREMVSSLKLIRGQK